MNLNKGIEPLLIDVDTYSGELNPHFCVSPISALDYVDFVADSFVIIDLDVAFEWISNASTYKVKLGLVEKVQDIL